MQKTQAPNTQRNTIAEAFAKALAATPKRIAPASEPTKQEAKVQQ